MLQFYRKRFLDYPAAQEFLHSRGLANAAMIDHFQIGFADRELGRAIPTNDSRAGRSLRERLTQLGIYRGTGHGHFNGCLVVPIFGAAGDVHDVYGRKITSHLRKGTPRHMHLHDPPRGVWNVADLAATDSVILCKSIIDGLTMWSAGFRNVTCTYGHGPLSQELLDTLQEHEIRQVLLVFGRNHSGEVAAATVTDQLADIHIRTTHASPCPTARTSTTWPEAIQTRHSM